MRGHRQLPILLALVTSTSAFADEGMWTLNGFPTERVQKNYGFQADQSWLDEVRLSSVRLARGCSGSLISADGLVLTNHHCAHRCIAQLSTKRNDLVERGFLAKSRNAEQKCPAMEVNQLVQITDVTAQMTTATKGLTGAEFKSARKAEIAKLEKACATNPRIRCDVVSLYHGGRYDLYKYKRFQDVRLAFAPELAIAFFGGDPDNFNFPRYVLDMALLRVYEDGKPISSKHHFTWSAAGAANDELVFVSGHPGRTNRLRTVAQLEYIRDVQIPDRLLRLAERRGQLKEFSRRGREETRIAKSSLFGTENAFKALQGRVQALRNKTFFATKVDAETALRRQVKANPKLANLSKAWLDIEAATQMSLKLKDEYAAKEWRGTLGSSGLSIARKLVRSAVERDKPNSERLPEYSDSRQPAFEARLFSKAPIYPKLERLNMIFHLTKLREVLGPDDPFVKKVLGKYSPAQLANRLLKSRLNRVGVRRRLYKGGLAAIERSKDPMIQFARLIDADARQIRKRYEDEVESVVERAQEDIAKARFAALGTSTYPDATFSLRVSYGQVKGFSHRGQSVAPFTTIAGAYRRATGQAPFALPRRWMKSKTALKLDTPMNFVSTNDIIGGNSGSPTFNKDRQIVGLVFDGNIYSLGGDYGFDETVNRTVSIDSRTIAEALRVVYGATALVKEIGL